jgi:uncharacterized protein (DUF302 family)
MKHMILNLAAFALSTSAAFGELVEKTSPHSVQVTMDKLEKAVEGAGAVVAARIDHAAAAASVDMNIAPNQVLIFGNPNIGSPIFAENPAAGLDLPIRVAVFQDAAGKTIVAYHDPATLAESYGLAPDMKPFKMMETALNNVTNAAISQ